MTRSLSLLALLLAILAPSPARGQAPGTGDIAAADALFAEGKRLTGDGRFAEACPRFEASVAIAPRLGVQLNLADCYEHLGRTASAWLAFGQAAAIARRLTDPREAFALERQTALVQRLSRLTIVVTGQVDNLVVLRDGTRQDPLAFGVDVPVDPGEHVITATAPGREPWSTRIVVASGPQVVRVVIPVLSVTPALMRRGPARQVRSLDHPPVTGRRMTIAAWVAASVATVALTSGVAFGLAARSLAQEARPGCDISKACSERAYALIERSRRDGNLSTAAFAISGVAAFAGVILYVHSQPDHPVRVVPSLGSGAAGIALVGSL